MSGHSLYGRLVAHLASDYQHQCDALHKHPQLINRFGEAVKAFGLAPHVKPAHDGAISMVACSHRGEDGAALLDAFTQQGYTIGAATKTPQQFNDGYVIWTAPIKGNGIEFTLLFYTELHAA